MGQLSSEQIKRLADDFTKMANALGDFRYANYAQLSEEENQLLKTLVSETLLRASELYTKSVILTMEEAEGSLQKLDAITTQTQELYKKLRGIQKVLDRANSVLTLASAILSLDAKAVETSLIELIAPVA